MRPNAATSNHAAGVIFNRHFTVGLATDGAFKIYALASTHLVIDVSGSFAPKTRTGCGSTIQASGGDSPF
ncbi:MAG: hypothetical protein JST85_11645 [Acidobacteria bacterium]|nr:hypothetical protein [Acidobacteriota bacterium]